MHCLLRMCSVYKTQYTLPLTTCAHLTVHCADIAIVTLSNSTFHNRRIAVYPMFNMCTTTERCLHIFRCEEICNRSLMQWAAHAELEMRFVMLTLRGVGLVGVESVEWAGLATGYVTIVDAVSPEGWFAVMFAATARR